MQPNVAQDPKKVLEFLKRNSNIVPKFCDSCGAEFTRDGIQIIGNKSGVITCRTHCASCSSTHILNVTIPVNGVGIASRSPVNVDLSSAEEFDKFAGKAAVSSDDAIDTYKTLDSMQSVNDFLDAIAHRKQSEV